MLIFCFRLVFLWLVSESKVDKWQKHVVKGGRK